MYQTGSGTVKKTDYLRNKSMVETIRSVVEELESKQRTVQAALLTVMGMDSTVTVELTDEEIPFAPGECDSRSMVERAYRSNPDVAKLEAAVKAAEAGVKAARSGHLPKVALFGNAYRIGNSYNSGIVTPENKSTWAFGFGVDIPIFEGFRVTNQEREARANLEKLQNQLALLRDGIALHVKTACLELLKSQQQQKSTREAWQSATENRELNVRAYQEELVETKDVIEAQILEALLSGQYQKTLYDHIESQAKLDFVIGGDAGQMLPVKK
jgi:outer membrane protein